MSRTGGIGRALAGAMVWLRDDAGTAIVEMAFVLPLLLLLAYGILDFGRAGNYKSDLTRLAQIGARYAVVNVNPSTGTAPGASCSTLKTYLANQADSNELKNMINNGTVHITYGTAAVGSPVQVTVSGTFTFLRYIGGKIGGLTKALTGSSTMRLEQTPGFTSC